MRRFLAGMLLAFASILSSLSALAANPVVEMQTSQGTILIELYPEQAPKTVENFLEYVKSGFYNGTIFHRVIDGFMIQGGGFTPDMKEKPNRPPITNEAKNGLRNAAGTIAMARTRDPHSAASQFYINLVNNAPLDYPSQDGWGYAVFGKVTQGMEVVNKIGQVPTGMAGPYQNVPLKPVLIQSARIVAEPVGNVSASAKGSPSVSTASNCGRSISWSATDVQKYPPSTNTYQNAWELVSENPTKIRYTVNGQDSSYDRGVEAFIAEAERALKQDQDNPRCDQIQFCQEDKIGQEKTLAWLRCIASNKGSSVIANAGAASTSLTKTDCPRQFVNEMFTYEYGGTGDLVAVWITGEGRNGRNSDVLSLKKLANDDPSERGSPATWAKCHLNGNNSVASSVSRGKTSAPQSQLSGGNASEAIGRSEGGKSAWSSNKSHSGQSLSQQESDTGAQGSNSLPKSKYVSKDATHCVEVVPKGFKCDGPYDRFLTNICMIKISVRWRLGSDPWGMQELAPKGCTPVSPFRDSRGVQFKACSWDPKANYGPSSDPCRY